MSAVEERATAAPQDGPWIPRASLAEFAELAFADFELHRAALGRVLEQAVAEQTQHMHAAASAPTAAP